MARDRLNIHRVATRYEKLAESFIAMLLLACISIWLQDLLAYRA
jgi:transposase